MKNEISTLNALIRKHIFKELTPLPATEEWTALLESESRQITGALIEVTGKIQEDGQIKRFVEVHQLRIIHLIETLQVFLKSEGDMLIYEPGGKTHRVVLAKLAVQQLIKIFITIEQQHTRYFNLNMRAAEVCKEFTRQEIARTRPLILEGLREKQVSPVLIGMITDYLTVLDQPGVHRIDFLYELLYLKEFSRAMQEIARDTRTVDNWSDEVAKKLVYLDFNTPEAYQYCIGRILEIVNEQSDPAEKIRQLETSRRYLLQLPVKEGGSYHPASLSLQDNLAGHLEEEMNHLRRLQEHALYILSEEHSTPQPPARLEVSLSVPQLAFLTHLMIETGIITTKPLIAVYRFISLHARTCGRKSRLSTGSFKNNTYKPAPKVVASVKKLLISMINYIHKRYPAI